MPANPTRSPSPAEVIRNAIDDTLTDVHCSNPAVVLSYNPNTQFAQVQPLLNRTFINDDGTVTVEAQPVINNVPVVWPAGGGFRLTFPLGPGDIVGLVFADQSLDIWKSQGGGPLDPIDQRYHSINDCWAIPQLRGKAAWTAVATDHVQLGQDGAAEDFVATAQRCLTEIQKLKTAFDAHTHGPGTLTCPNSGTGPIALTPGLVTGPGPTSASLNAPASSTVGILG